MSLTTRIRPVVLALWGAAACADHSPPPDSLLGSWTLVGGTGQQCVDNLAVTYTVATHHLLGRDSNSSMLVIGFRDVNQGTLYSNDDVGTVTGSRTEFDGARMTTVTMGCSGFVPVVWGCKDHPGDILELISEDELRLTPSNPSHTPCDWER